MKDGQSFPEGWLAVAVFGIDAAGSSMMGLNGIREAIRRQPFRPFIIRLADGRSLPVSHPEYVAVGTRLAIVVAEDNSWSVLEPLPLPERSQP